MKKTLIIIAPVYEEAAGIEGFYHALRAQLQSLSDYSCRILFVVDRGKDDSFSLLARIAEADPSTSVIGLSSRFGHQMSLLAGIDHARADVLIMMDADLQHPPALIPLLLKKYEEGNEIVYTIRTDNKSVGIIRSTAGALFYRILSMISDVPINQNVSDFRLISGRVATIIREQIRERNLFLRGIISWMGFTQASVSFVADERFAGKSKYSLGRLFHFAIFGIISFSKKPLRLATLVGFIFASFGFLFALVTIFQYFDGDVLPAGWATVTVLLSLFSGTQLIFLGILGEYIGLIFDEVKARPHYIIEDTRNLEAHIH